MKYEKKNKSILHVKRSKSKSYKHKKRGRKGINCIWFNPDKATCNCNISGRYNKFCKSDNCNNYKAIKEQEENKKNVKSNLSPYDENYIIKPYKASIHESDNKFIGISKSIGTPVHGEYLKNKDGIRRHKARCINYNKVDKSCRILNNKCIGSSHCNYYDEQN